MKALQAAWITEDDEKEAVPSHESKKHEHVFKKRGAHVHRDASGALLILVLWELSVHGGIVSSAPGAVQCAFM